VQVARYAKGLSAGDETVAGQGRQLVTEVKLAYLDGCPITQFARFADAGA
jgi:hypothetical protein